MRTELHEQLRDAELHSGAAIAKLSEEKAKLSTEAYQTAEELEKARADHALLDQHKLAVKTRAQVGALMAMSRSLRSQAKVKEFMSVAVWRENAWVAHHADLLAEETKGLVEMTGTSRAKDRSMACMIMQKALRAWGVSELNLCLGAWRYNTQRVMYDVVAAEAVSFKNYNEEQRHKLMRLANATNIQLDHVLSVYDTDGNAELGPAEFFILGDAVSKAVNSPDAWTEERSDTMFDQVSDGLFLSPCISRSPSLPSSSLS